MFLAHLLLRLDLNLSCSFMAEKQVCKMLREGSVVAIFGPHTDAIAEHIKSITDMVEIPFIDTRWQYSFHNPIATYDPSTQYTVNLHPDVATIGKFMSLKFLSIYLVVTYDSFAGQAYTDLAFRYGWDTVTILYEDNESMSRLKEILDKTADVLFPNTFKLNLKKLVNTTDNGYRDVYSLGSHSFLNYKTLANAGFLAGSEVSLLDQVHQDHLGLQQGHSVRSHDSGATDWHGLRRLFLYAHQC